MKGLRPWPAEAPPRRWQERAMSSLNFFERRDALVVATPGSGKTTLALLLAHVMLHSRHVERLVVVCPTDHLRRQWAEAAARAGVDIDPYWSNADGVEADDFLGVAVTYQQVSYAPDLYRMNCRRRTMVVFDEVHHAGDSLDWGAKLREAFEPAAFRLSLSGTPFRSDNCTIPFVRYEEGRSRADFVYGYGDALSDRVCRPVYFPSFEGRIRWLSNDGEEADYSLLDPVGRAKAAERLRAALAAEGNWLRGVLTEADAKLRAARAEGHRDAAGLVIAMDQAHAKRTGLLLRELTGAEPVVAISEDPDASRRIKRFAEGSAPWIVAVRMISEGVDIPRLRVGVYATNVQSELFFRQAVGRFVRMVKGLEEQSAYFYIPADESLIRHALRIKEEREHQLSPEQDKPSLQARCHHAPAQPAFDAEPDDGGPSIFTPLGSDPVPHDTIFDGAAFSAEDLARAEEVSRDMGLHIPRAQIAALLRRGAAEAGVHLRSQNAHTPASPASNPSTKGERKRLLRKGVHKLANRLARLTGVEPREIHRAWIAESGPPSGQATEEDLRRKKGWLIAQIREARR